MNKILSITIPTYNRAAYLDTCLKYLVPQVERRANEAEIVVCDNASADNTAEIVNKYRKAKISLNYLRNDSNLGYAGNQVKCIENASGEYTAILCDDDIYRPGMVEKLLSVLKQKEFAFVALNYYSFYENPAKILYKDFAPEKDVEFERAFDVMNYPSVGHYSGYVFNSGIAKEALKESLKKHDIKYFEALRGIIFDIAVRGLSKSKLPSYFIGSRLLAARAPEAMDYDSLYHLCLDYYEYNLSVHREGLTTRADLEYRANLVLGNLPRAIMSNAPRLSNKEINRITEVLDGYFKDFNTYTRNCRPLLKAVKIYPVKLILIIAKILKTLFKDIKRRALK